MTEIPFELMGGEAPVLALAERFYDHMEASEPALAKLHPLTPEGKIDPEVRMRFGLFLVGWLGGPQTYMARFGHPRLRMRHGHVAVNIAMRDAWLRCMTAAMDDQGVEGRLRDFLDARFAQVADFLRNVPETD